jgi:uncharacterized membrane protein (UPF0182 family)
VQVPSAIPRPRLNRRRAWLIGLAVLVFVLLVSVRGIAGFYTDYLWFQEVGFTEVWRGLLVAKALPAVTFTGIFFVILLASLIIADRLAPRVRAPGPEEDVVERYRQMIGPYAGRVRVGAAAFLALVAGSGMTAQWKQWVLFRNRVDFGIEDAQFHTDIGFYVFQLPFLRFVYEWAFAASVIVLIVTAVAHYLNGGIRVQGPFQRVTPQVKAHLSVILGAMALLKAYGYWLQRYELSFSSRGAVHGASYTDVNAQLPALHMLIVISVAAAVLFLVNIRLRGWVLPIIAVGLWSFVSVVIGGIYPAIIQRLQVEPNELQKERPYIGRNVRATRAAFGLEQVKVKEFPYKDDAAGGLTAADIQANQSTIGDARLWDPHVLQDTYTQLQAQKPQYRFGDVDIDRYQIDGETRQLVLAARELNLERLPSQTWQNRHLVYTHGYGIVASPSNGVTRDGRPDFVIKDIPPVSDKLVITQPALYYGEQLSGYAFVRTKQEEFDYPKEPRDATTVYRGNGGVSVSNIFRRVAFFLRFGDFRILISDQITRGSRAIYLRDIRDRVEKAAPFLHYDADPYPVLLDGRVYWVIDAYTATDRYPYAQSYAAASGRLEPGSGLQSRFNYVRNSVKVTVDAYDGTVNLYEIRDGQQRRDPIVAAYRKAFPKLFRDQSQMPAGLADHLRYPEDLFRVQTDVFAEYHVTDPGAFYNRSRQWSIAQDPGSGRFQLGTATTTAPVPGPGPARPVTTEPAKGKRMAPYYLQMQLPGQTKESFLILQPYVPVSRDDRLTNLLSFMVAKSDPGEYGSLEAYTMPTGQQVFGPAQVNAAIQNTPDISRELSLLDQRGSEVLQGSLLLIPVEDSILYIRPFYLQAEGGTQLPEFKFVVVVYGGRAVRGNTLQEALALHFPGLEPGGQPPPSPGQPPPPPPPGGETVASLLAQADQAYAEGQAALKAGDLAGYQRAVDRMADLIKRAQSTNR